MARSGQAACYSLRVRTIFFNTYGQIEGKEKDKRFEITRGINFGAVKVTECQ